MLADCSAGVADSVDDRPEPPWAATTWAACEPTYPLGGEPGSISSRRAVACSGGPVGIREPSPRPSPRRGRGCLLLIGVLRDRSLGCSRGADRAPQLCVRHSERI